VQKSAFYFIRSGATENNTHFYTIEFDAVLHSKPNIKLAYVLAMKVTINQFHCQFPFKMKSGKDH